MSVLPAVRLAPSAVNKQPWRVVVCGDKAHFYEKPGKGYVSQEVRDNMQYLATYVLR